jgi:hypothetical protein
MLYTSKKGQEKLDKPVIKNQERNKIVITPIPGLSTHCMEGLMSPTIEWSKI